MERGHEFGVNVPDDGTYLVKLLEGVRIEQSGGTTIGRWPAFGLEATGDTEAEIYQELLGALLAPDDARPEIDEIGRVVCDDDSCRPGTIRIRTRRSGPEHDNPS